MKWLGPMNCHQCGKALAMTQRRRTAKYCSQACFGDAQRGSGEGKTYRKLNGRHEHRVIAEIKLGRRLRKGEIVHHRDENILNNDPDNLEVTNRRKHFDLHRKKLTPEQIRRRVEARRRNAAAQGRTW